MPASQGEAEGVDDDIRQIAEQNPHRKSSSGCYLNPAHIGSFSLVSFNT